MDESNASGADTGDHKKTAFDATGNFLPRGKRVIIHAARYNKTCGIQTLLEPEKTIEEIGVRTTRLLGKGFPKPEHQQSQISLWTTIIKGYEPTPRTRD
jgi:hypothetical protein